MSRALKNRKRGRGRLPLPAKTKSSRPTGLSQYGGTEDPDPRGSAPKGADPQARIVAWK